MNLPNRISELIQAQNNHDSAAYVDCFSETAVVFDEGKVHKGKTEIEQWIARANEKYKTVMKPLDYTETTESSILVTEISGTFDGSPLVLNYHFAFRNDLIETLKVTG